MNDIRSFGYFFEALAVRDLRIYVESLMGHVEHYHDSTGLECDAVLHVRNGDYALVEIKLGGELVNDGATTLAEFSRLISRKNHKPPKFRMVLTATGDVAYRRPDDGIIVCPLSALRP